MHTYPPPETPLSSCRPIISEYDVSFQAVQFRFTRDYSHRVQTRRWVVARYAVGYVRGACSPHVRRHGNLHAIARPLRAAVYHLLGAGMVKQWGLFWISPIQGGSHRANRLLKVCQVQDDNLLTYAVHTEPILLPVCPYFAGVGGAVREVYPEWSTETDAVVWVEVPLAPDAQLVGLFDGDGGEALEWLTRRDPMAGGGSGGDGASSHSRTSTGGSGRDGREMQGGAGGEVRGRIGGRGEVWGRRGRGGGRGEGGGRGKGRGRGERGAHLDDAIRKFARCVLVAEMMDSVHGGGLLAAARRLSGGEAEAATRAAEKSRARVKARAVKVGFPGRGEYTLLEPGV